MKRSSIVALTLAFVFFAAAVWFGQGATPAADAALLPPVALPASGPSSGAGARAEEPQNAGSSGGAVGAGNASSTSARANALSDEEESSAPPADPKARPAQVDPSTPRRQRAFTLVSVQRRVMGMQFYNPPVSFSFLYAPPDTTGLWILPDDDVSLPSGRNDPGLRGRLLITGSTSLKDQIPLPWRVEEYQGRRLLFVLIPPGYSTACRWIDVSVRHAEQGTARWRVTHLPPMRHMLPPPVALKTAFKSADVTVEASASRLPSESPWQSGIRTLLTLRTASPGPVRWELLHLGTMGEWASPEMREQQVARVTPDRQGGAVLEDLAPIFYPNQHHYVRLRTQLRRFVIHEEKLTFPDVTIRRGEDWQFPEVPRTLTATTPSGITVTLPAQNRRSWLSWGHSDNPFLEVEVSCRGQRAVLPNSPLYKKYGKSLRVRIGIQTPSGDLSTHRWPATIPKRLFLPRTLADAHGPLTLIVQQAVDLDLQPITFTVPVQETADANAHPAPPPGGFSPPSLPPRWDTQR